MGERVRLGELLVKSGFMSEDQLREVLELQSRDGRQLGRLVVEQGFVTETQVTQILSQQLSVPWVSLHHIDFSRQLLNLVPPELAECYCTIPIYVRRIRSIGNVLYLAMDDPTNDRAIGAISDYAGLPVRVMIAPPSDIRAALRTFYEIEMDDSEALDDAPTIEVRHSSSPEELEPPHAQDEEHLAEPPEPAARAESAPVERGANGAGSAVAEASEPSDEEAAPPSSQPVEPRQSDMPKPRRAKDAPRMVSLTLLDGSTITLPALAGNRHVPPVSSQAMTAHDLIAALKARGSGTDAREVLGDDVQWEKLFAALLSVLMRKGLIADWEFIRELRDP